MAKVTFVQIGNDSMLHSDYKSKLSTALTQYPGAIIFGTYFDSTKQKTCQEIWANGKQYSVGAGSDARFYEGNVKPEVYFTEHSEIKPLHGDYYIQTTSLDASTAYGQDIDSVTGLPVQRKTAYVYDSTVLNNSNEVTGGWVVLDGNVSADNVYFPNGIRHNQAWGRIGGLTTSQVDWRGFNLTNIMKDVLLVSGEVPQVSTADNKKTDPTVTVSTNQQLSLTVYDDSSTSGNVVQNNSWYEVGTKLYIPATVDISYSGYNLTLTSEDSSISEGGATISGMTYGYWATQADANSGDQNKLVKSGGNVAKSKTGNPVNANFIHDASQTNGTCSLSLTKSGSISYTKPQGVNDEASTDSPSTTQSLNLVSATTSRVYTVNEGSGTIKLTGSNGNTWSATRSEYTIPAVGPIWVANNEYDKNRQETYTPSRVNAKTITSSAIADVSTSITVKGYYPVYSNIKKTTWAASTEEINKETKNDYSWSLPTPWSSSGLYERPVYIEYPQSKSITLTVGGVSKTYTPESITKTVGGVPNVPYYRIGIAAAYSEGQTIAFSLS